MGNCFRFLINIDQCLNMSHFDIFFYRLKSRHKFHISSVQSLTQTGPGSLRNAVSDIRMYLNKYPYHVGDYQITVAMRSASLHNASKPEETILYRLLKLEYELRRARIFINSREQTDKALNLILLYDADFSIDLPELGQYKESGRLQKDCLCLLKALNLSDTEWSLSALEQAVHAYGDNSAPDSATAEFLQNFLRVQLKNHHQLTNIAQQAEEEIDTALELQPLSVLLSQFAKENLCNIQLFEQQIDQNNLRQQILALLRVVEFINMDTKLPEDGAGVPSFVPLTQRCAENWKTVWSDTTLEQRYADMLRKYHLRLTGALEALETGQFTTFSAKPLPPEEIPLNDAITCDGSIFSGNNPLEHKNNLQAMLNQVVTQKFSLKTIASDWNQAYKNCKQLLNHLDHALSEYAEGLSRQYSATLEKRKKDSFVWRKHTYATDSATKKNISRLSHERKQRLEQLRTPQMNPSLNFQDQLNMENSLEQGNVVVQHYIHCLQAVNTANFLLLLVICAVLGFCHYTFLQTYVFSDINGLFCYAIYLLGIFVIMLLSWILPYNYFKRKLRAYVDKFRQDAERYISGYYTKAEQFALYINLLNQLDYITRYQRLLIQSQKTADRLSQGHLWHKNQLQRHLNTKLPYFHGLIELSDAADVPADFYTAGIGDAQVRDFIDSPIYWPQQEGE